jgi:hypothetical protein
MSKLNYLPERYYQPLRLESGRWTYPEYELDSPELRALTAAERGVLEVLRDAAWVNSGLPVDLAKVACAKFAGMKPKPMSRRTALRLCRRLRDLFFVASDGRLYFGPDVDVPEWPRWRKYFRDASGRSVLREIRNRPNRTPLHHVALARMQRRRWLAGHPDGLRRGGSLR